MVITRSQHAKKNKWGKSSIITRSQHVKKNIKNKKSIINGNQGRNKYNKPLSRCSSLYCRNKELKHYEIINKFY